MVLEGGSPARRAGDQGQAALDLVVCSRHCVLRLAGWVLCDQAEALVREE